MEAILEKKLATTTDFKKQSNLRSNIIKGYTTGPMIDLQWFIFVIWASKVDNDW